MRQAGLSALPLPLHTAGGTASQVLQSLTGNKQCTNNVEKVHSISRMHFLYGSKLHAALSLIYTVKEHFPNPLSWEGVKYTK